MKKMNESWDPIWEDIFINQDWGKYPSESLIQFIARNFYKRKRNKTKLLEIGCGPGANIWFMSREKFDVFGIDGSIKAIEIANSRLKNERLSANLVAGDIINLPYENDFFDGVIDVECLCCNNLHNTLIILKNINAVLKKDGLFYSRSFTTDNFLGKDYKEINKNEFKDIHEGPLKGKGFVRFMDKSDIHHLYSRYFDILTIDRIDRTTDNGMIQTSEWLIICRKK